MRVLAVATVGAATISWWPAFTLGAYQTVFFLCGRPASWWPSWRREGRVPPVGTRRAVDIAEARRLDASVRDVDLPIAGDDKAVR